VLSVICIILYLTVGGGHRSFSSYSSTQLDSTSNLAQRRVKDVNLGNSHAGHELKQGVIGSNTNNDGVVAIDSSDVGMTPVFGPGVWVDLKQPLSRISVGHAAWAFIHQTAAMYPMNPTAEQQDAALHFTQSLAHLYPCKMCRDNFRDWLGAHPVDVTSQETWQRWLCIAHNDINKRTDKPEVDCSASVLAELWPAQLKASCDCQVETVNEPSENKQKTSS